MNDFAKVAFEMLGTRVAPTSGRAGFIKFIAEYDRICNILTDSEICRVELYGLWRDYPNLGDIQVTIDYDQYDNYYRHEVFLIDSELDKDAQSFVSDRLDIIFDTRLMSHMYDNNLGIINYENIESICNFLSEKEWELYNSVENYEKQKLEGLVAPVEPRKIHKI